MRYEIKGHHGHSGPDQDLMRVVLLSKKWSALCMGSMNENIDGVSLTEWHRVTFGRSTLNVCLVE